MSNMFRASPWVTYEPTPPSPDPPLSRSKPAPTMDQDDVDMDAPLISTLREEESPPPKRKAASSRKAKAAPKVKTEQKPAPPEKPAARPAASEEDYDEPEEEEDQLIDDDDEVSKPTPTPSVSTPVVRPTDPVQKPKPITGKRKSRKSDKGTEKEKEEDKDKEEKEDKEKEKKVKKPRKSKVPQQVATAQDLAPTMSIFELTPPEAHEDSGHTDVNFTHVGEHELSISKPGRKKGGSPRKAPSASTSSKQKVKPGPKPKSTLPLPLLGPEDFGSVASEAPSSPATPQIEMSPEPEPLPSDLPEPAQSAEKPELPDLENVAIPQYPLPTKPFPVQLPPKINSGFAPPMPLDRSGKKVRHWRTANREIRGIAGGRWFARTWVGEKESEYSTAVATAQTLRTGGDEKNGTLMSKMPLTSISAPPGVGIGRGKRGTKAASVSLTASAAPSRSGSTGPDLGPGIPITSKPHVPTKMRVLQIAAESSAIDTPTSTAEGVQDVDMAPPPSE